MLIGMVGIAFLLGGCNQNNYATPEPDVAKTFPLEPEKTAENPQLTESEGPYAVFHTTAGDITVLLYPKEAPKTVENFILLVKEDYYQNSFIHQVVKETIVQGGKPQIGEERSSTNEPLKEEFSDNLHHFYGALAMGNKGVDTGLSQFYFVATDEIPEEEKTISANMYMNELIYQGSKELKEKINQKKEVNEELSEEALTSFETDLNQKIQGIKTQGINENILNRYSKSIETYMKNGGAYYQDYSDTVFGQVIEGLNIVDAMSNVYTNPEDQSPKVSIKIKSIEILESLEKEAQK